MSLSQLYSHNVVTYLGQNQVSQAHLQEHVVLVRKRQLNSKMVAHNVKHAKSLASSFLIRGAY